MAVTTNTKTMNITVDHFNEIIPLLEKLFNNEYPTNEELVNVLQQYVSQEALEGALVDYVTTEKLDEKTAGLQGLTQEQIDKINKVTELENTITTLNETITGLQALESTVVTLNEKVAQLQALESTIATLNEKVVELQTRIEALENPTVPPETPPEVPPTAPILTSIQAVVNIPEEVSITISTPLEDLKQYIVVNGEYDDETTKEITEYELQGTLTTGTSTITVVPTENDSITTTFDVTVA
ncbi:MAG: hypothetical protein MSA15_21080 [Clostridium sp.]|nr:hypothetical protein [Clostridium sp.]